MKSTLRFILVAAALLLALAPSAALAATAKTSLSDVEDEVMCPSCHEPLALAQSPQANAERNFIRMLIAQGQTKAAIKQALVAQYGTSVLARPPAQGFNLTVYVLPPALVLAGLAVLALTLPRWRRRTKARTGFANAPASTSKPSTEDERRLDEDLARYG
ncbi:MAG: cytochrome c-type biogenesis protein CcmH [Solirubrobacterales bacterium]|nr:cytochrome c-type biogenesis protein CcmH [Solirubrobacterales bacterium]